MVVHGGDPFHTRPSPSAGEGGPRVGEGRERGAPCPEKSRQHRLHPLRRRRAAPLPPRCARYPPPPKSGLPELGNPIADLGQAQDLLGGGLGELQ
ncbi:hypothetical protein D8770_11225 [Methylobacterium sp. DB1607]|nr:hypothetical protein [Methylobacterium sp. DB1607]